MPIVPRPSTLRQHTRVEFSLDEFRRQIESHGYKARWSQAALCPNRDPKQPDHHRVSCTICDHHGYVYYDSQEIWTHVTSYGTQQLFMPESRYEPGTAYFTTLPEHRLSFWDKIELLSASARYTEVKPRVGTTYRMRYPAISVAHASTSAGTIIPLTDVDVDANGQVVFDKAPGGDFITVSYFHHPTYIVIDLLHQIRDSRITLLGADQEAVFPVQAVGKLDFLVRDEGAV